jgi:hypothetical protein
MESQTPSHQEPNDRLTVALALVAILGLVVLHVLWQPDSQNRWHGLIQQCIPEFIGALVVVPTLYFLFRRKGLSPSASEGKQLAPSTVNMDVDGVATTLASKLSPVVRDLLDQHALDVMSRLKHHLPIRFWAASNSPHVQFVDLVDENLSKSTWYRYKGDRALYLYCRLQRLRNDPRLPPHLRIDVLLSDPRDTRCLEAVARYRNGRDNMSLPEAVNALKVDILCSVYGLYTLRDRFEITIGLVKDIHLYRIEMSDHSLFLSVMPSLQNGQYPDTAQYDRDSDYFSSFNCYFESLLASVNASDKHRMSDVTSDAQLEALLKKLGNVAPLQTLGKRLEQYQDSIRETKARAPSGAAR